MIIYFKQLGSRKVLKELYLTCFLPQHKDTIVINNTRYTVCNTEFELDNDYCTIWLTKRN